MGAKRRHFRHNASADGRGKGRAQTRLGRQLIARSSTQSGQTDRAHRLPGRNSPPDWLASIRRSVSAPSVVRGATLPLLLFIVWEAASRLSQVKFDYLSSPIAILTAGYRALVDGSVILSTWQTLEAAIVGLLLAIAIGVSVGALIGLSRFAEVTALPTIEGLRAIPSVAFIPLALLLFGYGLSMEGSVVLYACVWPVLIATIDGVRGVEPRLLEVGRALQFSFLESLWKIGLPAALARILVGIKIAAGFALVVAVTVEIVVNPRGLGYALVVAQQKLDVDLMYAQLLWLGLLGVALNIAIERIGALAPGSKVVAPA